MPFNIETATVQEAVDYSVQQIVKQGHRCTVSGGCSYGDKHGRHCAIGWLIDHDNSTLMNMGGGVHNLVDRYRDLLPMLVIANVEVFSELQYFHDTQQMRARLNSIETLGNTHNIDTSGEWFGQWVKLAAGSP